MDNKRAKGGQCLDKGRAKGGQCVDISRIEPSFIVTNFISLVYHQCSHSLNLDKERSKGDQCVVKERSNSGK